MLKGLPRIAAAALILALGLFMAAAVAETDKTKKAEEAATVPSSEDTYEGLKLFSDVLELIENNYVDPVEGKKLIEGALQGMLQSLDPHSTFLTPEDYKELQIDTHGEFGGLGIVIAIKDGMITVVAPIEGTPADKAGIRAGDKILEVDGESTKNMKLWESVQKMRGPKGSDVTITIFREGFKEPKEVKLTRDIIPIESVYSQTLKPGYGYIRITNFRDDTDQDVKAAMKELESGEAPLKGLVLDLRNNPGGLLTQAINVSDIFLKGGDVVSIKGRRRTHTRAYRAKNDGTEKDFPMVVLINGGSASASEIVAGALQDQKRALILGTTSFGKGSVQTLEPLRDNYGIKLTIARYYTPSGRSIQAEGIIPDIKVEREFAETNKKTLRHLREADLENHLAPAEEGGDGEEGLMDDSGEPVDGEDIPFGGTEDRDRYGHPTVKKLLEDNQIERSLEILEGYNLLSKSK